MGTHPAHAVTCSAPRQARPTNVREILFCPPANRTWLVTRRAAAQISPPWLPRRLRGLPPSPLATWDGPRPRVDLGAVAAGCEHRRPRRPCHYRAIHNGHGRSRADTHGQDPDGHDLRRSPHPQLANLPDLALQAGDRSLKQVIGLSRPRPHGDHDPGGYAPTRSNLRPMRAIVTPAHH